MTEKELFFLSELSFFQKNLLCFTFFMMGMCGCSVHSLICECTEIGVNLWGSICLYVIYLSFYRVPVLMCVHFTVHMWKCVCVCHNANVEVRELPVGVSSHLLLCEMEFKLSGLTASTFTHCPI